MFRSKLPQKLQGESILTATFIINRLPSAVLNWATPFERLYSKPPNLTQVKTFRCLCFTINTSPHKSKFEPRAFKCIFLGYVSGMKTYKLYDLNSNKILISRDVIFHEDFFPYHLLQNNLSQNSLVLLNPISEPNYSSTSNPLPPTNTTEPDSSNPYTDPNLGHTVTIPHSPNEHPEHNTQTHPDTITITSRRSTKVTTVILG